MDRGVISRQPCTCSPTCRLCPACFQWAKTHPRSLTPRNAQGYLITRQLDLFPREKEQHENIPCKLLA